MTESQAIDRSRGGMTTRILALTDALGNLVRFRLLPGHRFDTLGIPPLLSNIDFGGLIADKAFDGNAIQDDLDERGAAVIISQHPRRIDARRIDPDLYAWRHLIENFFCKLKELKRIAIRACKTDRSFEAMIHLAAAEDGFLKRHDMARLGSVRRPDGPDLGHRQRFCGFWNRLSS